MPKLNLRDDGFEEDSNPLDADQSVAPPPTLREVGGSSGGGKTSTLLTVILIIAALGLGVFALNYFKVIHLWGKKTPKVAIESDLPLPDVPIASTDQGTAPDAMGEPTPTPTLTPSQTSTPTTTPEPTLSAPQQTSAPAPASAPTTKSKPKPEPAPRKVTPPPSGTGEYTVQVSSWTSKAMADKEASRLSAAGMSAFVEDAVIAGENWYRVRIGRYASSQEAKDAADQFAKSVDGNIWVARIGGK